MNTSQSVLFQRWATQSESVTREICIFTWDHRFFHDGSFLPGRIENPAWLWDWWDTPTRVILDLSSFRSALDSFPGGWGTRGKLVGISPERRFSCLKRQRSAERCFSCCRRRWRQPSRTRRGPALPPSTPAPAGGTLPAAARLRTAATVEAAAPPRRSGSGVPCREGAGTSRCACSAC